MPMEAQMALAKGGLAVPLKIFTVCLACTAKTKNRRRRGKSEGDCTNERPRRKRNLETAFSLRADAAKLPGKDGAP